MDEVIRDSERIRRIYDDKTDITDKYERFVLSVKDNINNEIGAIKDSLANIQDRLVNS